MSSINPNYTFFYSQPDEYKLSHDSVFFARRIFEEYKTHNFTLESVLDLCAGSGIVGLDFLFHLYNSDLEVRPKKIDFVEIQPEYEMHFNTNSSELNTIFQNNVEKNFLNLNFNDSEFLSKNQNKYDLIFCNPPYFRLGNGKLSPSDFKNRCRYFIDAEFSDLINAIKILLKPNGHCYLILRPLHEYGIDVVDEIKQLVRFEVVELPPIRKSLFLKIMSK